MLFRSHSWQVRSPSSRGAATPHATRQAPAQSQTTRSQVPNLIKGPDRGTRLPCAAAASRRGQCLVQMGSLERLRQFHVGRRHVPQFLGLVVAVRSLCRCQGQHFCRAWRSSRRHSELPVQSRRRVSDHRSVEIRRRPQRHRQPISSRRRIQPEPEVPAYWVVNLALVLQGFRPPRTVRVGKKLCSTGATTSTARSSTSPHSLILISDPRIFLP